MPQNWESCRSLYDWTVDLGTFHGAKDYPDHFKLIIEPDTTTGFEDRFREAVWTQSMEGYLIAAEVIYWKNYGNHLSRNKLAKNLIGHLRQRDKWHLFCECVQTFAVKPTFEMLKRLQSAASQNKGFASLLTFVSFYEPVKFPMVDKHIANWWNSNKARFGYGDQAKFQQRFDGWIETTSTKKLEQNLDAYLAWTKLCREQAKALSKVTGTNWRARDVEMSVWESQKRGVQLEVLQE